MAHNGQLDLSELPLLFQIGSARLLWRKVHRPQDPLYKTDHTPVRAGTTDSSKASFCPLGCRLCRAGICELQPRACCLELGLHWYWWADSCSLQPQIERLIGYFWERISCLMRTLTQFWRQGGAVTWFCPDGSLCMPRRGTKGGTRHCMIHTRLTASLLFSVVAA